jgi:hypothetical protein
MWDVRAFVDYTCQETSASQKNPVSYLKQLSDFSTRENGESDTILLFFILMEFSDSKCIAYNLVTTRQIF